MNRIAFILLFAMFASLFSCGSSDKENNDLLVSIKTEFGEIKVRLYNETPEHKKNFLKLVEEGFYDDLLFHRVINNFMIQGGDPKSKDAPAGTRLGGGDPGYTLPSEFVSKYFHKKGALAAARKPDSSNPEKRSSGSQFYIIHGEIFSPGKLDTMSMMKNNQAKNELMKEKFKEASEELNEFRKNQDQDKFNIRVAELREEVDSIFETYPQFKFSEEQIKEYSTVGGYPSLDGNYTVFGEVVEGFDVLDKIAAVEVDGNNRPVNNIKIETELVK